MREQIKILGYKASQQGTELKILVPEKKIIFSKGQNKGEIRIDDGRSISSEQRRKAYATLKDIADYLGYMPEELKELMKYEHISRKGSEYISLSSCSMDEAREFINTLIEFSIDLNIPLADTAINRTDDINRYLYYCLKTRHCAVCGAPKSDLHHWDAIGMGNDRRSFDDSNNRKISLCRTHHIIAHQKGIVDFEKCYKIYGIIYTD